MTTQPVTITLGNSSMSKIFGATVTDGAWSLPLLDTISGQNLGILTPGTVYNWAQAEYNAGLMAWRIQRSDTLARISPWLRCLWWAELYGEASMPPTRINPTDILTVYAQPVDATANQTNTLAWITTTKGTELFGANAVADSFDTEMKSVINQMTLGDAFFNSTMRSITVQIEDGAQLVDVSIVDGQGGVVWVAQGGYRGATGSSRSNEYNLMVDGMGLQVGKGFKIRVRCITA